MRITWVLPFVICLAILSGCDDLTIDASSREILTDSIAIIRQALPGEKQVKFDQALDLITTRAQEDSKAAGVANHEILLFESLDGKTFEQVVAQGERIRLETENRKFRSRLEANSKNK